MLVVALASLIPDLASATVSDPVPGPPSVDVASYLVVDYDTGQILAEKDPHRALYPASTLKILTADTLIPRLDPDLEVTPKAADFAAEPDGSVVGMTAGVTYSVAELWRATFVESANDAVAELAYLSGGLAATTAAMEREARSLGAQDTTDIVDADGYDQDGQTTSAYDLALFARAGLHLPAFRAYCDLKHTTFPGPDGSTLSLTNHDPLVLGYPGMIGIKSGLTTKAGHTYVGAATRAGHTIIETLMLGGTDIADQAADLMDWAFAADGKVAPVALLGGSPAPPTASAPTTPQPTATLSPTPTPTLSPTPTPTPTLTPTPAPKPTPPPRPVTRIEAVARPRSTAPPWSGAAWLGAVAALAAVAVPVGTRGMHRRRM